MNTNINFIDLFAGAGGLSEGFIREGFNPVAHVELDKAACNTLLTRTVYHYLIKIKKQHVYFDYLKGEVSREDLYKFLPDNLRNSIINISIDSNNNKTIFSQIDQLKGNKKIDLIAGGPPCQAYSLIGRAADKNGMIGDGRNYLFEQYGEYLKKYKPKYFVFENVVGLLSAKTISGDNYLNKVISLFSSLGYKVEYKILNSSTFGVLQNRKRVILIGRKGTKTGFYPQFSPLIHDNLVNEIFSGLPKLNAGEGNYNVTSYTSKKSKFLLSTSIQNGINFTTQHISRPQNDQDKEIYKIAVKKWTENNERLNYNDLPSHLKTHKNRTSFSDRFKVVASEHNASHTVVAHIAKDGHYYIHPDLNQNRSLTPREAARLQSFPDDFFFEGATEKPNRTAAFKQIGNAVPPLMAQAIARELKKII